MTTADRPYHHGHLRKAVLDAAMTVINELGPSGVSLRDLARRAGVSHAAPAYHFRDKAGLLTAIAAEGYDLLAATLAAASTSTADDAFVEVGVAYVRFAVDHRAHFEVMYRPELYHAEDPTVLASKQRAAHILYGGVANYSAGPDESDVLDAGVAAWALMHGFAILWLQGAVPPGLGQEPDIAARRVARVLFRTP